MIKRWQRLVGAQRRHNSLHVQNGDGKNKEDEDEPGKRRREHRRPGSEEQLLSKQPLTQKNLKRLSSETASGPSVTGNSTTAEQRLRSTRSRNTSTVDVNGDASSQSTSSQRSTFSCADYRFKTLHLAGIIVRHDDIPGPLKHRVDGIVQPEFDEQTEAVVLSVADEICGRFPSVLVDGPYGADGGVGILKHALELMNSKLFSGDFDFMVKSAWHSTLQPQPQEIPHVCLRENAPKHPEDHDMNMPRQPSSVPTKCDHNSVRNPRPWIMMGFPDAVVYGKLVSKGVRQAVAKDMLQDMARQEEDRFSGPRPLVGVRLSSLVVEGTPYATGRSMFQTENKAAVSGSYMLEMQRQLGQFTDSYAPGTRHQRKEPLAFSVTQDGPILLLWVHYLTMESNVRLYNMHVLRVCHATIPSTTREFSLALAGVMRWAHTELLDDFVSQLILLYRAAAARDKTT